MKVLCFNVLIAGFGLVSFVSATKAATVVTSFEPGLQSVSIDGTTVTIEHFITAIRMAKISVVALTGAGTIGILDGGDYFDRGDSITVGSDGSTGVRYWSDDSAVGSFVGFEFGGVSGPENYSLIDFDGDDTYESVIQFHFGSDFTGHIMAVARNSDYSALTTTEGRVAMDPIPEASSLALIAFGIPALFRRRR